MTSTNDTASALADAITTNSRAQPSQGPAQPGATPEAARQDAEVVQVMNSTHTQKQNDIYEAMIKLMEVAEGLDTSNKAIAERSADNQRQGRVQYYSDECKATYNCLYTAISEMLDDRHVETARNTKNFTRKNVTENKTEFEKRYDDILSNLKNCNREVNETAGKLNIKQNCWFHIGENHLIHEVDLERLEKAVNLVNDIGKLFKEQSMELIQFLEKPSYASRWAVETAIKYLVFHASQLLSTYKISLIVLLNSLAGSIFTAGRSLRIPGKYIEVDGTDDVLVFNADTGVWNQITMTQAKIWHYTAITCSAVLQLSFRAALNQDASMLPNLSTVECVNRLGNNFVLVKAQPGLVHSAYSVGTSLVNVRVPQFFANSTTNLLSYFNSIAPLHAVIGAGFAATGAYYVYNRNKRQRLENTVAAISPGDGPEETVGDANNVQHEAVAAILDQPPPEPPQRAPPQRARTRGTKRRRGR